MKWIIIAVLLTGITIQQLMLNRVLGHLDKTYHALRVCIDLDPRSI